MKSVILLNADYQYLTSVSWKKAICLFYKGKIEILKYTDKIIKNVEKTFEINLPSIVKLVKYVHIKYKDTPKFSKYHVFVRDNFTCQYCNKKDFKDLTIDHVHPKSKGGLSVWSNVVSCCKKCNIKKGNKLLEQSGMILESKPYKPNVYELIKKKLILKGNEDILKEFF